MHVPFHGRTTPRATARSRTRARVFTASCLTSRRTSIVVHTTCRCLHCKSTAFSFTIHVRLSVYQEASMKTAFEFAVVGIGGIGSGALYWLAREAGSEVL